MVDTAGGTTGDCNLGALIDDLVEKRFDVGVGAVLGNDDNERLFREAVGRALCIVAQESESVTRCVCGIGVRIK